MCRETQAVTGAIAIFSLTVSVENDSDFYEMRFIPYEMKIFLKTSFTAFSN
jgi:hypothetical protein